MNFKKYISEAQEKNLIGMTIKNIEITEDGIDKKWHGKFDCKKLGLTSLYGAPKTITGAFTCVDNFNLGSLKDGPIKVGLGYVAQHCGLTSFEGAPTSVGLSANFGYNNISSLDGLLITVKEHFSAYRNPIKSFHNVHKHILSAKVVNFSSCPIESHVLGLLLIPNLEQIILGGISIIDQRVTVILNKHLGKGRAGILAAQQELIEEGLQEFAQL